MAELPTGTVTFLFTDLEGSTTRWEQQRQAMQSALARHDAIMRDTIRAHGGHVFKSVGDAFYAVFTTAPDAVAAAVRAQALLNGEVWDQALGALRVRMALHTGAADERDGDYFGLPLNRVARLLGAGHGGQILLSLATHELVRDQLPAGAELRDLGEHRLKDLIRPERIFQLGAPDLPRDFPPLRTLDTLPNNLPLQPTPFIGREREVETVRQRLGQPEVRLLTLTGPGGTGKTRLALQVAADLLDAFPDGVFFVNLAPLTDHALVPSAIAAILGVTEVAGQPLDATLKRFLHDKHLLLLLDNFEQVLPAAPLVTELLAAAARLTVLLTSRAVLGLYGEQDIVVPPLALPDLQHLPPLERLSQYEAVRLFIERAQAAKADFTITNENAPAVAEICHRLDGLPLAIELAAARIRLLPPQALLQRLSSRLKFLTGGGRDLPARQQTLRGAIAWSYSLLDAPEQQLFARLAVFAGGRTLEAVEAVCNAEGDLEMDVLDGVASLVDKSLLRPEAGAGSEARFVMLETIQEYAWERLEASGEAEGVRQRHAAYFRQVAEAAETEQNGVQWPRWLERLEAEHVNLRTALLWSLESGAIDIGLHLAAALSGFWSMRGYLSEGRRWLNAVLARVGASEPGSPRPLALNQAVAKALVGAGHLAWLQGDYVVARRQLEESVDLWRGLGDTHGLAFALHILGHVANDQRDYVAAQALFEESLRRYQALGDTLGGLPLRGDLGLIAYHQGDYRAARGHFEQSLPLYRAEGLQENVVVTLRGLGDLARLAGDYERAAALYEESLEVSEALRADPHIASARHKLAHVAHQRGNYPHMYALLAASLRVQRELGNKQGIAECLAGLGGWATAAQRPMRAARLFGATDALITTDGVPLAPADHAEHARDLAAVRSQLDEAAWQTAWAEGRAMSLEQAIAYALEETTPKLTP